MPSNNSRNTSSNRQLEVLRVTDQELASGNTQGKVYVQLSPGAAAILVDRPVAQARVSRQLREAIDKQPVSPSGK